MGAQKQIYEEGSGNTGMNISDNHVRALFINPPSSQARHLFIMVFWHSLGRSRLIVFLISELFHLVIDTPSPPIKKNLPPMVGPRYGRLILVNEFAKCNEHPHRHTCTRTHSIGPVPLHNRRSSAYHPIRSDMRPDGLYRLPGTASS